MAGEAFSSALTTSPVNHVHPVPNRTAEQMGLDEGLGPTWSAVEPAGVDESRSRDDSFEEPPSLGEPQPLDGPLSLDDVLEMPAWKTDAEPDQTIGSLRPTDVPAADWVDPARPKDEIAGHTQRATHEVSTSAIDVPVSPPAEVQLDPDLLPTGLFDAPPTGSSGAGADDAMYAEDAELPQTASGGSPEPASADSKEDPPAVRSRSAAGNAEELRYERLQLVVVDDEVERLLIATELIEVIGMPPVRCEVNLCPPGTQLESLKVHFNPKPWAPADADVVWDLVSQWLPRVWATLCNRERAQDSVVETWVSYKDPALPGEQHLRIALTLAEDTDFSAFGRAHRDAIEERTDGKWFDPVVVNDP